MKQKLFFLFVLLYSVTENAQFKVLLNFNDTNGAFPQLGSLTIFGNRLYGMTFHGGRYDSGCIFSIDTDGSGYRDIMDFNGSNGAYPEASLTLSGNVLYGMTEQGGAYNYGRIFSIHPDGSGYQSLLDFNGTNGAYPLDNLTISGGVMYGTTYGGGGNGAGCVFSIDTVGNGYQDLYDFYFAYGDAPSAPVTVIGNVLYGTAYWGASLSDAGCVFSLNPNANEYKEMLIFNVTNGTSSFGTLIPIGSTLYGTSEYGGTNDDGCIFSIDTNGNGYRKLLDFNDRGYPQGAAMQGSLILSGGVFYGVAAAGGINDLGCIFSVDTDGGNYRDLYDFNGTDGEIPIGSLVLSGNVLYGMTSWGGTHIYDGVVFSFKDTNIKPATPVLPQSKEPCDNLFIPDIFSPNGDGHDDILYVRGTCIGEMDFLVFDRWGNKIFESQNPNVGWDGTCKGIAMNMGTYIWCLKAILLDGTSIEKKGSVTLIR